MLDADAISLPQLRKAVPGLRDAGQPIMTVLAIKRGLLAGEKAGGLETKGSADRLGLAGLDLTMARDRMDMAASLRRGGVDAIIVDDCELTDTARLWPDVEDLPILAVVDEDDMKRARRAIGAGADDVLLLTDLADPDQLRRRIALAVERKAFERLKRRSARQDVQTGLANRIVLEERFARALARADRYATLVGLVAVDLDGFDALTARYGCDMTGHLLRAVGQRLCGEVRQTDTLARTRDHGFTWLVEGLSTVDDLDALVNRLPNRLARPLAVENQQIRVTVSVGVALSPFHGRDFQTVHGMAEAAMIDVSSMSGDALLMPPLPPDAKPLRAVKLKLYSHRPVHRS